MLFCSINSPLWRISSPKNGCQPDFYQEFDPYLGSLNVGEVMSQSTVQAKLCAGKNRIGSSIQAQSPGEVMGQRWRSYDLSDSRQTSVPACLFLALWVMGMKPSFRGVILPENG